MLTVYSEQHTLRNSKTELHGGELIPPFECPTRAEYIFERIQQVQLGEVLAPREFDLEPIYRIHDPAYIEFLQNCWQQWRAAGNKGEAIPTVFPARGMQQRIPNSIEGKMGYYAMAVETSINESSWKAAHLSANIALTAQEKVSAGQSSAFALCRPPGHHATKDLYGGYCFINNAAVCAQSFLDQGAKRVAILDVDFHHGNGTQSIFYDRDDVLFLSIHGNPIEAFPYFLGYQDETGEGKGEGYNVNYPLARGSNYPTWQDALTRALLRIERYAPDALVVSLGVDTFEHDPISFFKLKSEDFSHYGTLIGQLRLPTLFVMEGGYAVEEIGVNTVNVLSGFEDY